MKRFREIFITVVIFLLLFSAIAYSDTWTANKRLTNNTGWSYDPAIAVDSSNIYVVWADDSSGNDEIYFKKSDDGGVAWTPNKRLTWNAGFSQSPAIAVNGSNIYVVWEDDTPGNVEIYFKRSADRGANWTPSKRLTNNAGWSNNPVIAVDGLNIYVIWYDDTLGNWEIYFKKSVDGGAHWTPSKRLTNNTGNSYYQAIAVDGSNIYVIWVYTNTLGNDEIYFKKSVDGGDTWAPNKRLTNNTGYSRMPAIGADGSNVYVVWYDDTPGNWEIYFKKSVDGGAHWAPSKRLTNNTGNSRYPAIAVDGSNIYVVWMDSTPGKDDIYFKKSDDGGVTWTTNKRLTWNAGYSYDPAIAVDGLNIYVIWYDDTPGNWEIYFKKGILF